MKINFTKKILFTLFLFYFNSITVSAQDPINVVITGECSPFSGSYSYSGTLNGKNKYSKTFTDEDGIPFQMSIGFDNAVPDWVFFYGDFIFAVLFFNSNVPNGLLPPFTGWEDKECEMGTMTINQSLSVSSITDLSQKVLLLPNPSSDFITFQNGENANQPLSYKVIDYTGRLVLSGNSKFNEKINIEALNIGNYILELKDENGFLTSKKFLKK